MSDIDEGERDGDRAYDGSDIDHVQAKLDAGWNGLNHQIGFSSLTAPIRELLRAVELLNAKVKDQMTSIQELRDELRRYKRMTAPAISAARMHVPIGGTQGRARRVTKKTRSK